MSANKIDVRQYCNFLKGYVIAETPAGFGATIIEPFRHGLANDVLEAGISAFRELLYRHFDRIAKGDEKFIEKDKKKRKMYEDGDYRLYAGSIHNGFAFYRLGQVCKLATEPYFRLTYNCVEYFFAHLNHDNGLDREVRDRFQHLIDLGFRFTGVDFYNDEKFTEGIPFIVEHENDMVILGMKLMAQAFDNVKYNSLKPNNLIMRGDFYALANEKKKAHVLFVRDFVRSLSRGIAQFLINVDDLLLDRGCTVEGKKDNYSTDTTFVYFTKKDRKKVEVCKLFISIHGCSITYNEEAYPLNEETDFDTLQEQIDIKFASL